MNKLLTVLLCIFTFTAFGQINRTDLCKTWIAYKYQESNGRQFLPPPEMKKDYLKINPNGTYESLESGQLRIKGKWIFIEKDSTLTLTQKISKELPSKIKSKILKLTSEHFVVEGIDAGGGKLKIYSKRKK